MNPYRRQSTPLCVFQSCKLLYFQNHARQSVQNIHLVRVLAGIIFTFLNPRKRHLRRIRYQGGRNRLLTAFWPWCFINASYKKFVIADARTTVANNNVRTFMTPWKVVYLGHNARVLRFSAFLAVRSEKGHQPLSIARYKCWLLAISFFWLPSSMLF